ncbi:MAG: hypothetical protein ABIN58_13815, partial [candidate division WOR-3 bacterium]
KTEVRAGSWVQDSCVDATIVSRNNFSRQDCRSQTPPVFRVGRWSGNPSQVLPPRGGETEVGEDHPYQLQMNFNRIV